MGLKTKNYEVKSLGITLPEAYAIIDKLVINGSSATAHFAIQKTREDALSKTPIETTRISFVVDKNQNPYVQAYNLANSKRKVKTHNYLTGLDEEKEVTGVFYGWEDDIV